MLHRTGTSHFFTIDGALDLGRQGKSVMHVSGHGITTIRPRGPVLSITTEQHKIRGLSYERAIFDEYETP